MYAIYKQTSKLCVLQYLKMTWTLEKIFDVGGLADVVSTAGS